MSLFDWNDGFSIGIAQIDEHHQHLFSLLNKTRDDFINKAPSQDLSTLPDKLIDYVIHHILVEEYWMQRNRFPNLEMHTQEHDRVLQGMLEMQEDYHNGEQQLLHDIVSFLHNRLSTHILHSDAEYGRFMAAENKRMAQNSGTNRAKVYADGEVSHGTGNIEQLTAG